MKSALYVVATPIGNLADMTFRAVDVLKNVSLVACEDTRHSLKLLTHFEIKKPLQRYDEHCHGTSFPKIIQALSSGHAVALVTDAGTPTISDPGARLVEEVLKAGFEVIPIPGAASPVAALSATGMGAKGFIFIGFSPRKKGKFKRILQEARGLGRTVVFLESPFRLKGTLQLISEVAPGVEIVVAREMTKIHEEFVRGPVEKVQVSIEKRTIKGEIVLVIKAEDHKEPDE